MGVYFLVLFLYGNHLLFYFFFSFQVLPPTHTRTYIHTHPHAHIFSGSFFRVSMVPPGEYLIDGHSFKVFPCSERGVTLPSKQYKGVVEGAFHASSSTSAQPVQFAPPPPQVVPALMSQLPKPGVVSDPMPNQMPNFMGLQTQPNPLTMAQRIISQMAGESPESRNMVMTMMAQDVATLKRLNFHYEEIQRQQQEVQNILREWRWRCAMSTNQPTSLQMQPLLQSHMQPRLGPAGLQDPQGLRDLRGPQDLQGLWGLRRPPGLPQSLPGLGARGPAGLSAPRGLAANMAANIAVNPLGRVGSMPGGMVHPTDPQHYMLPQKQPLHHVHQMHPMHQMQQLHQLHYQMGDMRSRGPGARGPSGVELRGTPDNAHSLPFQCDRSAAQTPDSTNPAVANPFKPPPSAVPCAITMDGKNPGNGIQGQALATAPARPYEQQQLLAMRAILSEGEHSRGAPPNDSFDGQILLHFLREYKGDIGRAAEKCSKYAANGGNLAPRSGSLGALNVAATLVNNDAAGLNPSGDGRKPSSSVIQAVYLSSRVAAGTKRERTGSSIAGSIERLSKK